MLRRARLCHSMTSVRLSVCVTATFRYRDHIHWNISKIMSRLISLRFTLGLFETWAISCNGNTPQNRVKQGFGDDCKNCNISGTVQDRTNVLWRTNTKSHTRFRMVPKSSTLDDLERPKRTISDKKQNRFTEPTTKISMKVGPYCKRQNVGQWI